MKYLFFVFAMGWGHWVEEAKEIHKHDSNVCHLLRLARYTNSTYTNSHILYMDTIATSGFSSTTKLLWIKKEIRWNIPHEKYNRFALSYNKCIYGHVKRTHNIKNSIKKCFISLTMVWSARVNLTHTESIWVLEEGKVYPTEAITSTSHCCVPKYSYHCDNKNQSPQKPYALGF